MYEMKMPKLGASMTEGTIVRWILKEGDAVQKGDPVVEIQSDKIALEVESEIDGIMNKKLFPEGDTVAVFETIALVHADREQDDTKSTYAQPETEQNERLHLVEENNEIVNRKVRISPAARKLAKQYEIDIFRMPGSGPRGRVTKSDVERHITQPITESLAQPTTSKIEEVATTHYTEIPLSPIRKVIAERMIASSSNIPHVTLHMEVDVTKLLKMKNKIVADVERLTYKKLSINELILKATIVALKRMPEMMNQLHGDKIRTFEDIHLGFAVNTTDGLVVPVIKNAQNLTLLELVQDVKEIISKITEKKITIELFEGGTFTVSNLGHYNIEAFTPIINPPQSCILGVGTIMESVRLKKHKVKTIYTIKLSLSFDHRIVDGVPAANFLRIIKTVIENPMELFL